jgi:hypothetical protein
VRVQLSAGRRVGVVLLLAAAAPVIAVQQELSDGSLFQLRIRTAIGAAVLVRLLVTWDDRKAGFIANTAVNRLIMVGVAMLTLLEFGLIESLLRRTW